MGFLCSSAGKEFACNAGDLGSIPGWEDTLEKGSPSSGGIPPPVFWPGEFHWLYSCGVSKSQTRLSDLHFTSIKFNIFTDPLTSPGIFLACLPQIWVRSPLAHLFWFNFSLWFCIVYHTLCGNLIAHSESLQIQSTSKMAPAWLYYFH